MRDSHPPAGQLSVIKQAKRPFFKSTRRRLCLRTALAGAFKKKQKMLTFEGLGAATLKVFTAKHVWLSKFLTSPIAYKYHILGKTKTL